LKLAIPFVRVIVFVMYAWRPLLFVSVMVCLFFGSFVVAKVTFTTVGLTTSTLLALSVPTVAVIGALNVPPVISNTVTDLVAELTLKPVALIGLRTVPVTENLVKCSVLSVATLFFVLTKPVAPESSQVLVCGS